MRAIDGIRRYCIDIARWAADIIVTLGGGRRFILGTDTPTLDPQAPIAIDADEGASAGDITGIVADRPVLEGVELGLDLGGTLVDLLGQVLVALLEIALVDLLVLRPRGFTASMFLVGQLLRFAHGAAQAGETGRAHV